MKVIDLTHTITENMPVFPGTEQPKLTTISKLQLIPAPISTRPRMFTAVKQRLTPCRRNNLSAKRW